MSMSTNLSYFLEENARRWDEMKVREIFEEVDVQAILKTRVPQYDIHDRVAWMHSKEGAYSVKSGYQLWQSRNIQSISNAHSAGWKRFWNLDIPPKGEVFSLALLQKQYSSRYYS